MHNIASDSIADAPNADTHSSQDYVNTPKTVARIPVVAPSDYDYTSKSQQNTALTASTEFNIPTYQTDEAIQDEKFSCSCKYNLRPNPKSNIEDSYRY